VTLIQEERIRRLRKRYPYYGKKKRRITQLVKEGLVSSSSLTPLLSTGVTSKDIS